MVRIKEIGLKGGKGFSVLFLLVFIMNSLRDLWHLIVCISSYKCNFMGPLSL